MQAEFSVELGPQEAALEVPWSSCGGNSGDASSASGSAGLEPVDSSTRDSLRYFDLKAQPELLLNISETHNNRPLGEFLAALNSPASRLQTAKCDTWNSSEIGEDEQIFGAALKYASYVDLFFSDDAPRYSFQRHEEFANSLCTLLGKAPEIAAAAEFVLRRCYFHRPESKDSREGFCLSFYLSGYGDDEDEAFKRWCIGLKLVENAILQLAARSKA
jgi:hypothetical protein